MLLNDIDEAIRKLVLMYLSNSSFNVMETVEFLVHLSFGNIVSVKYLAINAGIGLSPRLPLKCFFD